MVVAVTGGTGFLGAHTVAALLPHGHRVRLLARDSARIPAAPGPLGVAPDAVEAVPGDVTDPAAAARLVSGVDGLLPATGGYPFDPRRRTEPRRVDEHGTDVAPGAVRCARAGRIGHVPTVGASYPAAAGTIGPGTPVGRSREACPASKAAAETIARRHRAFGAPVTITRPPALLGPHLGDARRAGRVVGSEGSAEGAARRSGLRGSGTAAPEPRPAETAVSRSGPRSSGPEPRPLAEPPVHPADDRQARSTVPAAGAGSAGAGPTGKALA